MTPQELQELIEAKEFTKIASALLKLTKKADSIEEIEEVLSLYDEIPKLSNWSEEGSGFSGFPTARFYLAVNICSLRDYDYLYSSWRNYGLSHGKTKNEIRKQYLNVVKLIFG